MSTDGLRADSQSPVVSQESVDEFSKQLTQSSSIPTFAKS
jgi:hypothetical protein